MTADFRNVNGLSVQDVIRYQQAMEYHGKTEADELENPEDIRLMLEYMKGFEPDRFDVNFELPEDVLIAKFDELDTAENTIADAYDKFAAWLSSLTDTPTINPPVDPPVDPEKNEVTDDTEIEFNGIKYYVYKKNFSETEPSEKLTYYKDENDRTVFESQGWGIKVIESLNENNDKNYANTVIIGDGNLYFGSNDQDTIEIQGSNNQVHGDTSDEFGDNDAITITSGTGNRVFGEVDDDSLITKTEGNFFNDIVFDMENVNDEEQVAPETPSAWQEVTTPNASQVTQMNQTFAQFGLPANAEIADVKQNGNQLGMTVDGVAYVSTTNADGTVKSIEKKDGTDTAAKVEYQYKDGEVDTTTMTDYVANTKTVTNSDGTKIATRYDDVSAKFPKTLDEVQYDANGKETISYKSNEETNVGTYTWHQESQGIELAPNQDWMLSAGATIEVTYDDITSPDAKVLSAVMKEPNGEVSQTWTLDYDNNIVTQDWGGYKTVSSFSEMGTGNNLTAYAKTEEKYYDADGSLLEKNIYKNGQIDQTFREEMMSVDDFFAEADINKDGQVSSDEVITLYNKTSDANLKGVLSYFTNGQDGVNQAFEIAATGGVGSSAYDKGDKTISESEMNKLAKDGTISLSSLDKLETDAAWANLVGGDVGNAWFVNGNDNDGQMTKYNAAYALTDNDGKNYHAYTMGLLNAAGGASINRSDLAKWGIDDAQDFTNKKLFNQLREGSDLVEMLDKMDEANGEVKANAELEAEQTENKDENAKEKIIQANKNNFSKGYSLSTSISAQNLLDMYNSCVSGENKDQAWAQNMIKLIEKTGMIEVKDGIAKIAAGNKNTTQVDANNLFKQALEVIGYEKINEVTA